MENSGPNLSASQLKVVPISPLLIRHSFRELQLSCMTAPNGIWSVSRDNSRPWQDPVRTNRGSEKPRHSSLTGSEKCGTLELGLKVTARLQVPPLAFSNTSLAGSITTIPSCCKIGNLKLGAKEKIGRRSEGLRFTMPTTLVQWATLLFAICRTPRLMVFWVGSSSSTFILAPSPFTVTTLW